MFNSLLNSTGGLAVDSLILNIVIILAVVIAGALIVYFLWEAITNFSAKDKKESSSKELDFGEKPDKDNAVVTDFDLDAEKTEEKVDDQNKDDVLLIDTTAVEDVNDEKAEEEHLASDAEIADEEETARRRAQLEARRQELIQKMQEEQEHAQENEVVEETPVTEEKTEENTEVEEVPAVEDEQPAVEESDNIVDNSAEENTEEVDAESIPAENEEKYQTMAKELEEAKKALEEQTVSVVEPVKTSGLDLNSLKERLADAEERLKTAEKEFKQCKKEYIPLRKVWAAHEKDEKKLRRKEALVAKQKVLLYGVNNYSEIDQDKAQKLAEDLDLLDGLKLSVQHCEEVMKKNEQRYPLLEKMYNVLKERNDELKADVARYREEISKLESEQGADENK